MQHSWRTLVDHILKTVPADQLDSMALVGPHPEVLMPVFSTQHLREPQSVLIEEYGRTSTVARASGTFFLSTAQSCRQCGCSEYDCRGCWDRTGGPCHWVEPDLCSACVPALQVAADAPVPTESVTA